MTRRVRPTYAIAFTFSLVASGVAAAPAFGSAIAVSASDTGCEGNPSQVAPSLRTAPEEVKSRLTQSGDPAAANDLLLAPALTGGDAAQISVLSSDRSTQLVGASEERGRLLHFEISLSAGCKVAPVPLTVSGADEFLFNVGGETGVVVVGTPWAFDSTGRELGTWYEDKDGTLAQFVDATDAVGTVYFDPTYTPYTCTNGYYSALSAGQYLDLYSSSVNYGYCVPAGLFNARNGYLPVWAFETNVANDYGLIPVDSAGGCSFSPDTGWAWDFQVPCKAHDYCYDLRKAGFSGTVSDGECDNDFYWLMEAHCNDRVLAGDCRIIRDRYYAVVSAPGVVTDPDPAAVSVKVQHSLQCADVSGRTSAG